MKKFAFIFLVIILALVCYVYYMYVQSFYVPNKNIDPSGFVILDELGVFGNFFNGVSAPLFGFASIFNNLVSEYRTSQSDISIKKGRTVFVGKKVFKVLNSELQHFYGQEFIDNNGLNDASLDKNDLVKRAMDLVHVDYRLYYEQHLKLLYNILKYIDQKCSEKDKDLYAGMLRSFIPIEEEKFIYYEALQEEFKKFKLLLEKYSMMHDIKNDLIAPEHTSMYDKNAFA